MEVTMPHRRKPTVPRLARKLRAARQHAGISPAELAHAVGVDPSLVTHVEAGRKRLSSALAERVALALGVHISELNQ
jgi:transcriptional regulator with XRE-family HTH domain